MDNEWPLDPDQVGVILCANNLWLLRFSTKQRHMPASSSSLRSFALEAVEARRCGTAARYAEPRTLLNHVWDAPALVTDSRAGAAPDES